ncbi:NAD-dependent epimerase/dehydratase family protein [Georgenia ruanii]|uniref:NAD-dependent epimerase/dehydratase family protein n=1 Tax=Georgenia ruanii TaxID=348442 RepID=A0A7J9UTG1_9MICO|nr:NAD-dependent epimerase/dehydratase family protein [Georgenia ruanii]MPV87907.1 NAD-dependent epimerase/dehydratase family protein [Georgenia ruanii]
MSLHVVIGAGPVGSALATLLAGQEHDVRVVTRSGRGPVHPRIARVSADVAVPGALMPHVAGAVALYNCANPASYQAWARDWPPLAAGMLRAAEDSGAVLVTMGNLYGYGPVSGPITADHPLAATTRKGRLRARLWEQALDAHHAGRLRAVEIRASDYLGPAVTPATGLLAHYAGPVLSGRPTWVLGDPDAPHSWTYVPDAARTLAAAAADERAWGQAWHVPTNRPVPVRAVLEELARIAGRPAPRIRRLPRVAVTALSPVVPVLRELRELLYQFERPFEMDAAATVAALRVEPTPWSEILAATAADWAGRLAPAGHVTA